MYTFYAPNAFTPDGNGNNETFLPQGHAVDYNKYYLSIYDRWGELIYKTDDYTQGWDGTVNGLLVQEDVYIWKVDLKDIYGISHHYIGRVTIIR